MTIESYLSRLAVALEAIVALEGNVVPAAPAKPAPAPAPAKPAPAPAKPAPAPAKPAPVGVIGATAPAKAAPVYKDVQDAGQRLIMKKGRDALMSVFQTFGVAKGPDLDAVQFEAAIAAINAEIDKPDDTL
jgi:hypothetical protein